MTIKKDWRSQNLLLNKISLKENLKKCNSSEEQKGTRYIWDMFILRLLSSADFHLQNRVSDFF